LSIKGVLSNDDLQNAAEKNQDWQDSFSHSASYAVFDMHLSFILACDKFC